MNSLLRTIGAIAVATLLTWSASAAPPGLDSADPLVAVDRNRTSIIADIVRGFESPSSEQGANLKARLERLRADRLLAASLTSSRESLEAIIAEDMSARATAFPQVRAKALGDTNRDVVYTPLTPCRLIDTRGFGAPIVGGSFSPNTRRAYLPSGLCDIPTSGVSAILMVLTTQNLTPNSGGYVSILSPGAPVSGIVDVFNFGSEWSATNTSVATGPAGEFDAFVSTASAHIVVDVVGFFGPPPTGSVGTAQIADGAVTAAKLAHNGCTPGQVLKFNGTAWTCSLEVGPQGPPGPAGPQGNQGLQGIQGPPGPISQIDTGTGLVGGPITSTGTISIAVGGVGSTQIADGSVTSGKLDASIATGLVPAGFMIVGTAPTPPTGFSLVGPLRGSDEWKTRAPFPTSRARHATAGVAGKLYVIGGEVSTANDSYDPSSNSWTSRAPLPVGIDRAGVAAAQDGKIYHVGGLEAGGLQSDKTFQYDPQTDTWLSRQPMLASRADHGVAALNGRVYAIGGDPFGTKNEAYDIAANAWTSLAPIPTPRNQRMALIAASNGKLYAIGGAGSSPTNNEEYDPSTNTWAARNPFPIDVKDPVGGEIGGKIYIRGGGDSRLFIYDIATNCWSSSIAISGGVGASAAVLDSKLYVVGGDQTVYTTAEYTPVSKYLFIKQ